MHIYSTGALLRNAHMPVPAGLSVGGRIIWIRTGLSVATCNTWASLLGIGVEARHG